jgi:NADH dehydrogenase [ubiquinone] 1 alpha subcomplex assembly factor 7
MRLQGKLVERIRRSGPITFADLQEAALYDPDDGFFASGGGAGRAGRDFVTSPETGQLFGALLARHVDTVWRNLGSPDPFLVVDAGAGRGKLAADVLRAAPACAPALRYVLVERSPALRALQRDLLTLEPADEALGPFASSVDPDEPSEPVTGTGPIVTSIEELPGVTFSGLVVANELLDNLPIRLVERAAGCWQEVLVAVGDGDALVETLVPAPTRLAAEADAVAAGTDVPDGARLPVPEATIEWLDSVAVVLRRGAVLIVDYCAPVADLVARGQQGWLRTYRGHERGADAFARPGSQDITTDVPLEHLAHAAHRAGFEMVRDVSQRELLTELGIEALVEEGRTIWQERAHLGDLEAIAGRSRGVEAAALTDPVGLGAHRVIVLEREPG